MTLKMTPARKRMLLEAATEGTVDRTDERRHKTFRALADEGLLQYLRDYGWVLSQKGGELAHNLFADVDVLVLSDPFRDEHCGISEEAFKAGAEYHEQRKVLDALSAESRRLSGAEARERVIRERIRDELVTFGAPHLNEDAVFVQRVTRYAEGQYTSGFFICVKLHGGVLSPSTGADNFSYSREYLVSTQAQLDRMISRLLSTLLLITSSIDDPQPEEDGG